ncbi:MAG: protein translocase subunit SecF [Candidatus Uhrbacteria bacterium]|nr:protein translocase subunit SecF [Candidatus Uhrbacteria bacterium]
MHNLQIIKNRNFWLGIAIVYTVIAFVALGLWGLKAGIEYTGGSLLEVEYSSTVPAITSLSDRLGQFEIGDAEIKSAGEKSVIFRFRDVNEEMHQKVLAELKKDDANLTEKAFESIGPVIGQELKTKSVWALIVALILICLYISFVFRKVSHPVASWKYGVVALVTLFHDVPFVLGLFAILGKFGGIEITSTFIPAILTVIGFSVHDTIVVFDRIRENLQKTRGSFEDIVNASVNQTIVRSLNTSLTVLLVLAAIFFFGGESLKYFALALIAGIGIGTYSSIFIASPLLVMWHNSSKKK